MLYFCDLLIQKIQNFNVQKSNSMNKDDFRTLRLGLSTKLNSSYEKLKIY